MCVGEIHNPLRHWKTWTDVTSFQAVSWARLLKTRVERAGEDRTDALNQAVLSLNSDPDICWLCDLKGWYVLTYPNPFVQKMEITAN